MIAMGIKVLLVKAFIILNLKQTSTTLGFVEAKQNVDKDNSDNDQFIDEDTEDVKIRVMIMAVKRQRRE